ncbi:MAG TPA: hypothetical protein PKH39_02900 [Woeseiaceae bacterium]|nr:hypothetical protein [Woeseiaceae bacterium]
MKKHDFFIVSDDGSSINGFIIKAYSRQQIQQIFGDPNSNWISIFESNYDDHEIYVTRVKDNLEALTFDVDRPTGMLEYYMQKNKVIFAGSANNEEIERLSKKHKR